MIRMASCNYRVLLVEDELEARELLSGEVGNAGYGFDVVADAQQAMEMLANHRHEVVVVDVRLPGMDGVELTRWIKQMCPNCEVILITGHATVEAATEALRLGACDYLVRPLHDINEIRASLLRASERLDRIMQLTPTESERVVDRKQLLGLLDLVPLAVLLLDEGGAVRGQNRFAHEILQLRSGLRIRNDKRLECATPSCTSQLRQLLENAAKTPTGETPQVVGGMRLESPDFPGGLPLLVVKLGRGTQLDSIHEGATLVALPAPDLGEPGTIRILADLYGLTPAEARLATLTLRGCSLEFSARELGITEPTARTHLRHIFGKTRTSRQGELVSTLLSGPALLSPMTDSR